jgi:hypothetical protein
MQDEKTRSYLTVEEKKVKTGKERQDEKKKGKTRREDNFIKAEQNYIYFFLLKI